MNSLITAVILVVMTSEYLVGLHLLPRSAKYLPELLSALVLLCVIVYGVRYRFRYLRPA
jgi:hypothetical protein